MNLSFDEAKTLLLCHAFMHHDLDHPKMATGFLGSLRPFQGLNEVNFHEVMACLRALATHLSESVAIDREIAAALFGMCHFARAWGVAEDGMLRRNGLISPAQSGQLAEWVDAISYASAMLLDGASSEDAFEGYRPASVLD